MSFQVISYVCFTVLRRIGRFFLHWYTEGSRLYWHSVMDFYGELERMLSLQVTLANWYRPLYGDYSRLGMFIGIPVRLGLIIFTSLLYAFLFVCFLAAYLLYLGVPVFLLSRLG